MNRTGPTAVDDLRTDSTAALDHPEHCRPVAHLRLHVRPSTPRIAAPDTAATPRLVYFHVAGQRRPVVLVQERADLLEHPMRGLVGDADLALQLLRADAAASGRH